MSIVSAFCGSSESKLRIALYSHDTMGLGHIRRNQLIAHTLADSSLQPNIFLISGTAQAAAFALPSNVDRLILPSFVKDEKGRYRSKSSHLTVQELVSLRGRTIQTALEAFAPDVLIVDKVPRGTLRELDPTLEALRIRGRTLCILGLRDVLDEPHVIQKEWKEADNEDAIRLYYDAVWIYGDRSVYHAPREYHFSSELMAKVRYTGYHDQRLRLGIFNNHFHFWEKLIPELPYVLCVVGGGQDGGRLAQAFVRSQLPPDMNGVLITGPYMPVNAVNGVRECIAKNPRFIVMDFLPDTAPILKNAKKVIGMGGYNTVCEVLSFEKPSLIVPREVPRKEQLIRAQCFQEHGLLDLIHWENVTPDALSEWMHKEQTQPVVHGKIDFHGLSRIESLLRGLVENAFGVRSA